MICFFIYLDNSLGNLICYFFIRKNIQKPDVNILEILQNKIKREHTHYEQNYIYNSVH